MIWPTKRSSQLSELGRKESNWRSTKPQICTCSVCVWGNKFIASRHISWTIIHQPLWEPLEYIYISDYIRISWIPTLQMTGWSTNDHSSGGRRHNSWHRCLQIVQIGMHLLLNHEAGWVRSNTNLPKDASEKMRRKAAAKSHLSPSLHPNSYHTCETGWHWEKK